MSEINEFPIKTRVFTVEQFKGDKGDFGQLQSVTIDGDDFVFTDNNGNTARLIDAVPQLRVEASDLRHDELTNRDLANQHPISAITNLQEFLDGKVDAVIGQQLSDENYTLAEKTKLANVDNLLDAKVNNDDPRLTDAREWVADGVPLEEAQSRTSGTYRKWSALRVGQAIIAWWESTGNQAVLDDLISAEDLANALAGKVDKVAGFGLSQANFTQDEKDKLAALEDSKFKGLFEDLAALQAAHPTADAGSYAFVDGTAGNPNQLYVWATDQWEVVGGEVVSLTPAQVKQLLLENADTNNFSDAEKQKLENAVTQSELASALTSYAQTAHGHTIAQVTGLQEALDSKAAGAHGHVIGDVSGLQSALDSKAASSHSHAISQVTDLSDELGSKVDKVGGKGLSTNDYDNSAKSKVDNMGTAASRDATVSAMDLTSGRLLKFGDWGLTDKAVLPPSGSSSLTLQNNGVYSDISGGILDTPDNWGILTSYFRGDVNHRGYQFYCSQRSNLTQLKLYAQAFTGSGESDPEPTVTGWKEIYHTGNAVGTVSQSEDVPTGAIIQRGSTSGRGEFVRYADGTQICWHVSTYIAPGVNNWPFPAVFANSSVPVVTVTSRHGVDNFVAFSQNTPTATSVDFKAKVIAPIDALEQNIGVCLFAIGRWY